MQGGVKADTVCINYEIKDSCKSNFNFFVVNSTNDTFAEDGVLGLGPTTNYAPQNFVQSLGG